jgi:hypothetical protein
MKLIDRINKLCKKELPEFEKELKETIKILKGSEGKTQKEIVVGEWIDSDRNYDKKVTK